MLYYDSIDLSQRIDVTKSNKERMHSLSLLVF